MDTSKPEHRSKTRHWIGVLLKIFVVFLAVYGVHLGIDALLAWADANAMSIQMRITFMILLLLAYAIVIAFPFVPGVEIALSLFVLRGPEIAPAIYIATVFGLSMAYFIGHLIPEAKLAAFLRSISMNRIGDLVLNNSQIPPAERLTKLRAAMPLRLGSYLVKSRYVVLALLLNLPGNIVLGGGGGLSLVAGLSRLFRPIPTVLTIALATAPVPLIVWFFGPDALGV